MTENQKLFKNCIGELYDITITTLNNVFGRKKHISTQFNGFTITINDMIRELDYMGLNTQDDKSIKRDNRRNFLVHCEESKYIQEFFKIYSNYLNGGNGFTSVEELNQACIIKNSGGNIITIFAHILGECLDNNFDESKLNEIIKNILRKIKINNDINESLKKKIKIYLDIVKEYGFSDLDFNMTILSKIQQHDEEDDEEDYEEDDEEDYEEEIKSKKAKTQDTAFTGGTTNRTITLAIKEINKITTKVNYGDIPRIKKYIEIIKNSDIELIKELGFNDEEIKKIKLHIEKVEELIENEITNKKKQEKEKLDRKKEKQLEKKQQEKQKDKAKKEKDHKKVRLITIRQQEEKKQEQQQQQQQQELISKMMKKNIKDGFLLFRIKTNHKVKKVREKFLTDKLQYLLSDHLNDTSIHNCNDIDFDKMKIKKNQLFKQTFQDSFLDETLGISEECKKFLKYLKKEKDLLGFCKDKNIELLLETLREFNPGTPDYILLLEYQHNLTEEMNNVIKTYHGERMFTGEDIESLNSILSNSRILNIFRDVFHNLLTSSYNKNILSNLMDKINRFYGSYGNVGNNNFIQRINPTPLIKGDYFYRYLSDNCFIYDDIDISSYENLSYGVSIIETQVSIPYVLKEAYDSGIMDFVESHDEEYISPEDLIKSYEDEIEKTNKKIKSDISEEADEKKICLGELTKNITDTREKNKKKLMDEFKFLKEDEDPFSNEDLESLVNDILENKLFHGHYKEITYDDPTKEEKDTKKRGYAEGKLKKKRRTFGKIRKKLPRTFKKLENINKKVKKGLTKLRNTIKNKKNKLYNKFTRKNKNSSVKPKKGATIKKIANFFKNKRSKKVLIKKL